MEQRPAGEAPYVFLSYASTDRERALAVADALEAAGVRVWLDRQAIAGGTSWGSEIVEGIKGCAVLVILCTRAAMASRNVKQEIQLAWRYERAYLPLLLESVEFPEQVQYFLEGWQWVELLDRPDGEWLPQVLRALARLGADGGSRQPAVGNRAGGGEVGTAAGNAGASAVAAPLALPAESAAGTVIAAGAVAAAAPVPSPIERLAADVFVGREKELAALRGALGEALAGHGRLVLLAGEPGIGKTRLAEELTAEARERGAQVLWGRCWEGESAPAFWPWVEAVRGYLREHDAETVAATMGAGAAEIAAVVPEVRAFLPDLPPLPAAADPEQARFRLFEVVAGFLRNASVTQPLLLVLDDLHWADKPSLLLLQFVVRTLAPMPLLLVGAYRDVELNRTHPLAETLAVLRRERGHERLLLQGLSAAETEALVAGIAAQELSAPGRTLAAALWRETEGNPFFLQETIRHLVESGKLVQEAGRWTSTAQSLAELGIPEGVREVIGRRLSRLSEPCNALLAVAAVAGREFHAETLERAGGEPEEIVDAALEEAEQARVIAALPGAAGRYRFTHALIRETLYEELPARRRTRLHRRVGEALEALYARSLEAHLAELAHHFLQAAGTGDAEQAIDYAIRAGEAARAAFGYEDAASLWQAALELLEEEGDASERHARLLERLGNLMYLAGFDLVRGVAYLERALQQYEALGEEERAAQVHSRLGLFLSSVNAVAVMDIPQALGHLRAAEAVLSRGPERAALGYLYVGLGAVFVHAMQPREGVNACRRAMAIGERLGNEALWANAAIMCGLHLVPSGRVAEGLELLEQGWQAADRLNHGFLAFQGAWLRGTVGYALSDPHDAEGWLLRELSKPRLAHAPSQRRTLLTMLTMSHVAAGELAAARRVEAELSGDTNDSLVSVATLRLMFAEGQWEEYAKIGEQARERTRNAGDRGGEWAATLLLAQVCQVVGDRARAEALLQEGLDLAHDGVLMRELEPLSDLALVLAESGRLEEAHAGLVRCREIVAQGEDWRGLAGKVDLAEAAVAGAERRFAEAEPLFARAVATFQRYTLPWDEADAHSLWGRVLLAAGEQARAADQFDAAADIYRRIGAGERWLQLVDESRTRPLGVVP